MENQEVMHKEGSGILSGTFISCSVIGKTRAYLPSEAVRSPAWYEGSALLHMSFCRGLAWWWCFLQSWNGSSFFPPATVGHCVHSDASGTFAFLDQSKYFIFQLFQQWHGVDISAKKMVPIVMAAALWEGSWSGMFVYIQITWQW